MGDVNDRPDAIEEEDELADVVASLDEPDGDDSIPASDPEVASAEDTGVDPEPVQASSADPIVSGEFADEAAPVTPDLPTEDTSADAAVTASDATAVVDSEAQETESDDPAIAALQAELEVETQESVVSAEPAESLDDIAPPAVGGEPEAHADSAAALLPDDRAGIPVWPFIVYFVLWVAFAGVLVWQVMQAPSGMPIYELPIYGISILVGLVLTALGPFLAIAVWLSAWLARPAGARAGLFSRSLIIGAVTTLAGVALWLVALGAVDVLRLGRFF